MEMSQGEEKDMLLKGFKKLSRILAGQLWLLREDEIRKIYFSLRETRRKVLSGNYGGVRASVSEIHFFVEGEV
ncbi:MAG: hypothetical protein PHY30_03580 [Candidatus Pacebacteria bacterium]|nr:hypothetical protein [Candidatus Paceibacterota bacterium]